MRREEVVELQEGDCFNLRGDDRWLLLEGEVKVVGINGVNYRMGEGYFFFLNTQTKLKYLWVHAECGKWCVCGGAAP